MPEAILGELEPISFDDLPLGGEWTTRRRTISESEIALFAALAGDLSPLTIDTSGGEARLAPPSLLGAMAAGLGSVDMPIPQVATWEWVNWKFPRPVRAGETIYARWTLTQKRPPVHGSKTGIVVWRVDVYTADGTMCAEGEVGAAVFRRTVAAATPAERVDAAPAAAPAAGRRRRKRRTGSPADAAAPPPPAPVKPPAPAPAADRAPRRRRRRRPSGSAAGNHADATAPGSAPAPSAGPEPAAPVPPPPAEAAPPGGSAANPISRVMRRLRRT